MRAAISVCTASEAEQAGEETGMEDRRRPAGISHGVDEPRAEVRPSGHPAERTIRKRRLEGDALQETGEQKRAPKRPAAREFVAGQIPRTGTPRIQGVRGGIRGELPAPQRQVDAL